MAQTCGNKIPLKKGALTFKVDFLPNFEGNNFETLPTAFFPKITEINDGKEEFRRLSTSPEFTKRVAQFTNNIIEQANQINGDEAFSNIFKWIEFSDKIFETINSYRKKRQTTNSINSLTNDRLTFASISMKHLVRVMHISI